jgi:hypothetical protein
MDGGGGGGGGGGGAGSARPGLGTLCAGPGSRVGQVKGGSRRAGGLHLETPRLASGTRIAAQLASLGPGSGAVLGVDLARRGQPGGCRPLFFGAEQSRPRDSLEGSLGVVAAVAGHEIECLGRDGDGVGLRAGIVLEDSRTRGFSGCLFAFRMSWTEGFSRDLHVRVRVRIRP